MPWPLLSALKKVPGLLSAGRLDTAQQLSRIESMERNIGLPVRAGLMVAAAYYLFLSAGDDDESTVPALVLEFVRGSMISYLVVSALVSGLLLFIRNLGWGWVRWVVFTLSLMDGFFLAAVTLIAGGFDSGLYWLFFGLLVRNAISVPVAALQILLNLSVCLFYAIMTMVDASLVHGEEGGFGRVVEAEPFILRLALLLLTAACCYGIQVIYDRNRRALEELREFSARQGQLSTAGRMAAGIAHQIKNPLAIINNAAFNLQRAAAGDAAATRQLEIIREEVDRADGIITRVMGFAELSEARVEPVDPRELAADAIAQVFPPGLAGDVRVETDLATDVPKVFVLRRHLEEALVNLLQNAREAVGARGTVRVSLRRKDHDWVEFAVEDSGPGIPAELRTRVFEPYFTTKPRGSGLGLAIVERNCELYGGRARVESPLGKGARFILDWPAKTNLTA